MESSYGGLVYGCSCQQWMARIGIHFDQPKMSMLLMVHHFVLPFLCHAGALRKSFTT